MEKRVVIFGFILVAILLVSVYFTKDLTIKNQRVVVLKEEKKVTDSNNQNKATETTTPQNSSNASTNENKKITVPEVVENKPVDVVNSCTVKLIYENKTYSESEIITYKPGTNIKIEISNKSNVSNITYGVNQQVLGTIIDGGSFAIPAANYGTDIKNIVVSVLYKDGKNDTHSYLFKVNEADMQ